MSKSAFSAFLEKQMGINKYTNLVINIGKFLQKLFDNFARKKNTSANSGRSSKTKLNK